MRAKSAVIIRVDLSQNFPRLRRAGVATCARRLRGGRARQVATALPYFDPHGVVQNLSRVYTFYLAGRTGRPGWAPWLCGGCRDPELAASGVV